MSAQNGFRSKGADGGRAVDPFPGKQYFTDTQSVATRYWTVDLELVSDLEPLNERRGKQR
jgi:hypothetical protein